MLSSQEVIRLLGLEPLPVEGGYFRETYRCRERVPPAALETHYAGARNLGSAIYFFLDAGSFSAMHRLRSDEIYHFYAGTAVEMLLCHPDGASEVLTLGTDLLGGQRVQKLVPAGTWQGSRLTEGLDQAWALLGTTMTPAWDPEDFELGRRDLLVRDYPLHGALIRALTRD